MLSDLKFACRQLVKAPGFTAVVVVTLALAIGACTIVFSAVNSILFDTFYGPEPERTVLLRQPKPGQSVQPMDRMSLPDALDIQRQAKSFESLAISFRRTVTLTGRDEPRPLLLDFVCRFGPPFVGGSGYTKEMALGRNFLPEEFAPGRNRIIIVSHGLWQETLGGDPKVLGQTLLLDGVPHTVIGVLPPIYERRGLNIEGWVPYDLSETRRGSRSFDVFARLRAGVTQTEAQAEMDVIAKRLGDQYPETNRGYGIALWPFATYMSRFYAPVLRVLFGAVLCVLLIACANVANLVLVRAAGRQREIAVRAALGATAPRLMGQLFLESLLLALLGGAAGVLLAQWGLEGVRAWAGSGNFRMFQLAAVRIDWIVLAAALGLSAASGLLFGLAPAWLASRVELNESLRQGARGATESGARGQARRALVVFEIACAVVLLAGAGLLIRSFVRLTQRDFGWDPGPVAIMKLSLIPERYGKPEQRLAFADVLLDRLQALPGVDSASASLSDPFQVAASASWEVQIEGRPQAADGIKSFAGGGGVTPGYFKTTGIRLLRGRLFNQRDNADAPRVALINETMARQHFPGEDPIGRRICFGSELPVVWREIIGIVSNVAGPPIQLGEQQADRGTGQLYIPYAQGRAPAFVAMVRTAGDPAALLPLMKQQVYAMDKDQPVRDLITADRQIGIYNAFPRFTMEFLGAFALVALVIAAVGVYGVMAYSVSQRTAEIGIRMALGAGAASVLRQVLGQGLKLVAAGLLFGLGAALAVGRLIQSHLFETSAADPLALALVVVVLAAVGLLACWVPARKATKVDPIIALRAE